MLYHILLAAGRSRRFGSNKLLYEVGCRPMYELAVDLAVSVQPEIGSRIIFVTSYRELAEAVGKISSAHIVYNDRPEKGISRSIRLGLRKAGACPEDWLLFSVCDQPWLEREDVLNLVERGISSGKGIAALSADGEPGNPVLFSGRYQRELASLTGDRGGKCVLKAHWEDVLLVEARHRKGLADLDTRPKNGKEGNL